MKRCIYCYKPLNEGEHLIHPKCCRRFFGTSVLPRLEYNRAEMDELALKIIQSQTTLTGVQPKLSLHLDRHTGSDRLTIVGLWGDYILKPQSQRFSQLPENEDLTMHLAEAAKINVVPHSLIPLADGTLAYITKRIDRGTEGNKIDMEDLCQLTHHPTEYKYKGSYEQVGKIIGLYSAIPNLDLTNFMQVLLFCFITGNNDMHLKNFSLYRPMKEMRLTPAYDLLNVAAINPADHEEMALTVNGRKAKLTINDFIKAGETFGVDEKVTIRLARHFYELLPKWKSIIDVSFLTDEAKSDYLHIIEDRLSRI